MMAIHTGTIGRGLPRSSKKPTLAPFPYGELGTQSPGHKAYGYRLKIFDPLLCERHGPKLMHAIDVESDVLSALRNVTCSCFCPIRARIKQPRVLDIIELNMQEGAQGFYQSDREKCF